MAPESAFSNSGANVGLGAWRPRAHFPIRAPTAGWARGARALILPFGRQRRMEHVTPGNAFSQSSANVRRCVWRLRAHFVIRAPTAGWARGAWARISPIGRQRRTECVAPESAFCQSGANGGWNAWLSESLDPNERQLPHSNFNQSYIENRLFTFSSEIFVNPRPPQGRPDPRSSRRPPTFPLGFVNFRRPQGRPDPRGSRRTHAFPLGFVNFRRPLGRHGPFD